MSNDFPRKRKFTALIDLTTRGQEVAKAEVAHRELAAAAAPPDPDAAPAIEASFSLAETPEIVQKAAANAGWDRLMPVQEKTIPVMLSGRDVIVQSKTGSGKTGAFLLPLFSSLDSSEAAPQALVLTPTRELARQIYEEFIRVGGPSLGFRAALVYGGVAYGPQQDALRGTSKEGAAQVVIGTPGRILDHLERRTFTLDRLKTLVLDEADEMLSMGFLPAMRKLHRYLSGKRQSAMFSATMPPSVRALAQQFLDAPTFLALAGGTVQIDALQHRFYEVDGMEKDRALIRIIEMENPESAIIFANTKREVEYLAQFLRNYGHDAGEISGDLNQNAREAMMARIRAGNLRFLIATDVAARGIDISDLSHVVQYDVPIDPEYYVHRAGRTARAGKTGVAITFVAPHDKPKLLSIFRRYDLTFEQRTLPTEEEVAERVRERLTVLLEERYRETKNLTRERIARFEPLARALAEEEPHLLAFLLDEAYHESLHRAPQAEVIETSTHRGLAPLPREERSRDRGRKGRRREHDDLYEAQASDEGAAPDEAAAPEPTPAPSARQRTPEAEAPTAPVSDAPAAAPDAGDEDRPASEEPGEGGRRRKKRRRKKRRGDAPASEGEGRSSDDDQDDGDEDEATTPTAPSAPEAAAPEAREDRSERRERGGRGGRGRGRQTEASEETPREEAPATTASRPSEAPAPTRTPEAPRSAAAPSSPAKAPEASAARKTAVPPGPYRIQSLRALPEATLRAVGEAMEIGESGTIQRDDLVYRILEVQAERESTGRGRRPGTRPGKPAAPARSQAPAKPAPAPKPAAPAPPAEEPAAPEASEKPARPSRGRGRAAAKPAAPSAPANDETPVATVPEPTAPEAPKRARRSTKRDAPAAPDTSAEAPAAEAAPAEKPARRRTRKAAEPDTASTPEPSAPAAEAAKPRRRRKADAPPLEPVAATPAGTEPAAEAPKPRARRKKADAAAPEAAPAESGPAAETPPAPKPRARRKPKQDDGTAPDAA